ncbi:MAG: anhydro-N-acetylmuramic acid kinase [Planctomycetes bacterium]|nr:anhydro-N-acetylmuramic acid kinase [Planctomycetota bacterium]
MRRSTRRLEEGRAVVAGVLSGTSADGVDVVLARPAVGDGHVTAIEALAFETRPFQAELGARVRAALGGAPLDARGVTLLSRDLGRAFGAAARALAEASGLELDLVGSHGQTVWHHDDREPSGPASLQLGDGDWVAEAAGATVVSDFRQRDLAAGGLGAPLSALADDAVFAAAPRPTAVLNLGGVANLSWLPARGEPLAFDTGPAGALLDGLARRLLDAPCDRDGAAALRGRARPELVERWLAHPFFGAPPPKSTGRDTFGAAWLDGLLADAAGRPGRGPPGERVRRRRRARRARAPAPGCPRPPTRCGWPAAACTTPRCWRRCASASARRACARPRRWGGPRRARGAGLRRAGRALPARRAEHAPGRHRRRGGARAGQDQPGPSVAGRAGPGRPPRPARRPRRRGRDPPRAPSGAPRRLIRGTPPLSSRNVLPRPGLGGSRCPRAAQPLPPTRTTARRPARPRAPTPSPPPMTGMRRHLGLLTLVTAMSLPAMAMTVDEATDLFNEGVALLNRGEDEAALEKFTAVLALDPSNEAAYELWKVTDHEVWLNLLVKGGQYELVAKRLMDRAKLGNAEQRDDEAAIRGLLRELQGDDVLARAKAIRALAADHGEYAVQYMLPTLADENAGDRRVLFMQTLTEMGTDVVLPLAAALRSDDAYLRRNVALVLGYIGDPRAAAALTWHAYNDEDAGVKLAAEEAAKKCGGSGDALALFLKLGDDYHHRRASVLRAVDYSDVTWSWQDGALVATAVPRFLYNEELSKNAYYDALATDSGSLDARAGLARAYVAEQAELELRAAEGLEDEGLAGQLAEATIAVNTAGIDALDRALTWAVRDTDAAAGVGLIRALGMSSNAPTASLNAAQTSGDGALRGEAAVALGEIALRSRTAPGNAVVHGLGEAAGREVLRIGVVIDGDEARGRALADAMAAGGMVVNYWNTGATGLALLKRAPGVDVIVVADTLPDLTADQVVDEIRRDERTAATPLVMITADEDADWGDRITATMAPGGDLSVIEGAMSEGFDGDRARADELAARAALTLAGLARSGADVSAALPQVAASLASRPDSVTVPAMEALGAAGTSAEVAALAAVLMDDGRSDAARVAAADALAQIAARERIGGPDELLAGLAGVVYSDASLEVRVAASRALSNTAIDDATRAEITRRARVDVAQ